MTAAILPGFAFQPIEGRPALIVAVAAALLLGLVNLLIRPIILLLALLYTTTRSAWIGMGVGTLALAWRRKMLLGTVAVLIDTVRGIV